MAKSYTEAKLNYGGFQNFGITLLKHMQYENKYYQMLEKIAVDRTKNEFQAP